MSNLTTAELNAALHKIRAKYDQLVRDFKKSSLLRENFEDRYLNAIRTRQNLTMFVLGEIEAVDELYRREEDKALTQKAKQSAETQKSGSLVSDKSFADQMAEQNAMRMRKYPAVDMGEEAADDISRLMGAVRILINDYFPALNVVFRDAGHSVYAERISSYYNRLMSEYDYKGDVPMARRYKDVVSVRNADHRKIDYEYRYVLQETAFLLNDIYSCLSSLIRDEAVPMPAKKIVIMPSKFGVSEKYKTLFNGKKFSEAVLIVKDFLDEILIDFRLHSIKRT